MQYKNRSEWHNRRMTLDYHQYDPVYLVKIVQKALFCRRKANLNSLDGPNISNFDLMRELWYLIDLLLLLTCLAISRLSIDWLISETTSSSGSERHRLISWTNSNFMSVNHSTGEFKSFPGPITIWCRTWSATKGPTHIFPWMIFWTASTTLEEDSFLIKQAFGPALRARWA